MNRTKIQTRCHSVFALALSALLALACVPWMLGVTEPEQAQAAGSKTISDVYGVTRSELVSWLSSHENDTYYLTTPYKPFDWRSPNGDINGWGANSDGSSAGMNCTGFVWHALCAAHGWKDGIGAKLPALSGWSTAITSQSLENYTFSTKEDMLASGKLEKGDVIWMWDGGDMTKLSNFHHVGIFWGDSSDEDLMWHSSGDAANNWSGINERTKIHGKASVVSYQIVKLGGQLFGGIALQKESSDESVTKGNDAYSLKDAVYGIYSSKEDAETHKAKKAIKTFSTNANGAFKSDQEFEAGTYFVAEIEAPLGYALDSKTYKVKVVPGETVVVNSTTVKDEPLLGGIELVKRSTWPQLTDGNARYTLKGAVYGVFATKADAKTHDADKALKTHKTNEDGTFKSNLIWAAGTYFVAETEAPRGYVLDNAVYKVVVAPGEIATVNADEGFVSDSPQSNPVDLWAAKRDAETADGAAQGSGSLAGTLFEISYYDGFYKRETLPSSPFRTWIVASDADGKAYARDDLKVSGDEFFRTADGRITIPLGTVTVREKQPPNGYRLDGEQGQTSEIYVMQIRPGDGGEELGVYVAPEFSDHVARGGVVIGKIDRQNGLCMAQGAATLMGAEFSIVSENDQGIIVNGTRYEKGDVVESLVAGIDDEGTIKAQTASDLLPVGRYTINEVGTSDGYLLDDVSRAWSQTFEITSQGEVVDLTEPDKAAQNQVIRGDFLFSKVDGQTGRRLGLIPFLVTSQTTGEHHVIMTDENGMVSTASSWNAHSSYTNANDKAISPSDNAEGGFSVDEEALDPTVGIWFDGRIDAPTEPDDTLGALPYDTYTVSELRSTANEGYDLATFSVRISRHDFALDLGTVDDNPGPLIGTSFDDGNGVKLAPADSVAELIDTVHYTNLDVRETYQLIGELHLTTPEGSDAGVVATAESQLMPQGANGNAEVSFAVDTTGLEGARLVAFERLAKQDGTIVAVHEDLSDEGQSLRVPSVGTTLVDNTDGDHGATADEAITLIDIVSYRGLTPGQTYILSGVLHERTEDGIDVGPALDEQGREINARQAFTPAESEGVVEVVFSFAAPNLAGKTVVAFEELVRNERVYAVHADIDDEEQTVRFTPPNVEEGKPPAETPPEETPPAEEPPAETPPAEEPPVEQPPVEQPPVEQPPTETAPPGKATIPKTGDVLDITLLVLAAAASAGMIAGALCIRKMQRDKEITINRGPDRS